MNEEPFLHFGACVHKANLITECKITFFDIRNYETSFCRIASLALFVMEFQKYIDLPVKPAF
jgi:hypothetical protein